MVQLRDCLRVVVVASAAILCAGASANLRAQDGDLKGGASDSEKPPKSPSTRSSRTRPSSTPKSTKRTTRAASASTPVKVDLSKQVEAALNLGNSARDSKPPRYADAEQAYRLAIALDPEDARAYVGLGNIYFDQKHYAEAVSSFNRAITLDPQDAAALIALAYTNNAQELYVDAERSALRALAIDPNQYAAYAAIGWSKYRRKNYQEAETAYRRAIAFSPGTPEIYGELSAVLMAQDRWRDSEPVLLQAVTLDPTNAAMVADYAFVLHKLGRLDKAAETYAQAIKLNSNSPAPHSNIALIQYTRGDFAKAREEWETALRLNSAYALDRVGLMILDRKFKEAQAELEKFTQSNPTDEDGWLLLGDVRRMQSDSSAASAAYARASQIAPEYAQHARPTLPEPPVAKASPPAKAPTTPSVTSDSKNVTRPASSAANDHKDTAPKPSGLTKEPRLRYSQTVRTVKASNDARPTPASGAISVKTNANAVVLIEFMGGGAEAQMSIVPASLTVVAFRQLRPGEYRVAVSLDGFEPVETNVFVSVAKIISVTFPLKPKTK